MKSVPRSRRVRVPRDASSLGLIVIYVITALMGMCRGETEASVTKSAPANTVSGQRVTPYRILAILPATGAPQLSKDLREAIAHWELIKTTRGLNGTTKFLGTSVSGEPSVPSSSGPGASSAASSPAAKIMFDASRLFLSPVPVADGTQRILPLLCDALEIHNPSFILSLLGRTKSYYGRVVSECSSLPFVSLTGEYRDHLAPWEKLRLDKQVMKRFLCASHHCRSTVSCAFVIMGPKMSA